LTEDEIRKLYSDYKSEPYRDKTFSDSKDAILERRIEAIRKRRL
jgi:hypothetical protein